MTGQQKHRAVEAYIVREGDLVPRFVANQMRALLWQAISSNAGSVSLVCDTSQWAVLTCEEAGRYPDAPPIAELVAWCRDVTGEEGVPYQPPPAGDPPEKGA